MKLSAGIGLLCLCFALGVKAHATKIVEPEKNPAQNFCTNGGFEDGQDAGRPACWDYFGREFELTSDAHSGNYAIILRAEGSNPMGLNRRQVPGGTGSMITLKKGRISFWYKIISSETKGDNFRFFAIAVPEKGAELGRAQFTFPSEHVGDGKWHRGEFSYDFSTNEAIAYIHVAPRINEGGTAGKGEIILDDIAVSIIGPKLRISSLSVSKAVIKPGDEAELAVGVENCGDMPAEGIKVSVSTMPQGMRLEPSSAQIVDSLEPERSAQFSWKIKPAKDGIYDRLTAVVSAKDFPKTEISSLVIAGRTPPMIAEKGKARAYKAGADADAVLENESVRLIVAKNIFGYGCASIDVMTKDGWKRAAGFPHLGFLALNVKGRAERYPVFCENCEPEDNPSSGRLKFSGKLYDSGKCEWKFSFIFELKDRSKRIEVESKAWPSEDRELLCFQGVTLLAGEGGFGGLKDEAWVPGLEYLSSEEQSSNKLDAVYPISERYVPHPHRITIPLLAVVKDSMLVSLQWDMLQKWDGTNIKPSAVFSSPNHHEGQDNHLMALFVPSVPEWVNENEREASKPYKLGKNKPVTLKAQMVADYPAKLINSVDHWFSAFGVPDMPEMPRTFEEGIRLSLDGENFRYVPEKKGWYGTSNKAYGAGPNPDLCVYMWIDSIRTPDAGRKQQLRGRVLEVAKKLGTGRGINLSLHLGKAYLAMKGEMSRIRSLRASQKPDGGWAWTPPDKQKEILGKKGKEVSGITARNARDLMRIARITGDSVCLSTGMKALKFLETVDRIPRGGQTWEVPLHTPDVIVAADACMASIDAYRITADKHYLDEARYWAYTGIPFFYMWKLPERPIMLYASIPVLGATMYVGSWFGQPVQWCGIAHIYPLLHLAKYDNSLPWRKLAEGMTICSMQQQFTMDLRMYPDKKDTPDSKLYWDYRKGIEDNVGLYPDNFALVNGKQVCWEYMISPNTHYPLTRCIYNFLGVEPEAQTEILRSGDARVHITTVAKITKAELAGGKISVDLQFFPEEICQGIVCGISRPAKVTKNGTEIPFFEAIDDPAEGWEFHTRSADSQEGFLVWKITHSRSDKLEISGSSVLPVGK